jgi:hypothetical protein
MGRYASYYQYNDGAKRGWMLTKHATGLAMLSPSHSMIA